MCPALIDVHVTHPAEGSEDRMFDGWGLNPDDI